MTTTTPPLPDALTAFRGVVDPALRAAVDRLSPMMRQVAGYHMGWIEADGRPREGASGKAVRPALVLLSAQAGGADVAAGVPAAVAVELVHAFSLLHDDIMDGDRQRRHRPTAWAVYGMPAAILAGDALLTLAEEVLLEEGSRGAYWASRCLAAATQRLISGQSLDLEFERRIDVTLDESVAMAGDKTAALLACACSIGAMLVGAPAELAEALAGFGSHLGLAFQLVDDLLGIWGSPEVTGKPVLSDLRTRKKSLPVVAALNAGRAESQRLSELLTQPQPLSEEDLRLAAKLVDDAGGREWAQSEADRQLTCAQQCLERIGLAEEVAARFLEIARFVTSREN